MPEIGQEPSLDAVTAKGPIQPKATKLLRDGESLLSRYDQQRDKLKQSFAKGLWHKIFSVLPAVMPTLPKTTVFDGKVLVWDFCQNSRLG